MGNIEVKQTNTFNKRSSTSPIRSRNDTILRSTIRSYTKEANNIIKPSQLSEKLKNGNILNMIEKIVSSTLIPKLNQSNTNILIYNFLPNILHAKSDYDVDESYNNYKNMLVWVDKDKRKDEIMIEKRYSVKSEDNIYQELSKVYGDRIRKIEKDEEKERELFEKQMKGKKKHVNYSKSPGRDDSLIDKSMNKGSTNSSVSNVNKS
jgi:hypothetical protein